MRWSKGWIAATGVLSVVAAIGGTAFALAGSDSPASQSGVAGKEVCAGKPLAVVDFTGPAGVVSNQFPVGTSLRISNLANGRAVTLAVVAVSQTCASVNAAAFDLLQSPDAGREAESVLRRVRVEIVGNAPAPVPTSTPTRSSTPRLRASGVVGQVICDGATVGLSAVGGAPGAFSSQLPIGTSVRVTNLDNGRQATFRIVGVGSGCVVLNSAAFDLVGESGKNLVKRAQIEKVT
ncbi:hypothetical protein ACIA8G_41555 [Lentzea sp. NPDC051213]|uniref:hypothetical protein n=1 Tax=Lentzea sp. NPDC051213 TaxID=3364126 RepID=UPI0037AFFD86